MKVAIVKYNAGNVCSVLCALRRLGVEPVVTDNPVALRQAERVIFPGVGEASSAMRYLSARGLDEVLRTLRCPVLGICLGLQLLCAASEEGSVQCLGVFPEQVRKFRVPRKVPHMGWNSLLGPRGPLFSGISEGAFVYFVHSYFAECGADIVAACDYEETFSAALHRDNFFGVQFHPEKSGPIGARILRNFLQLER